MSIVKIPQLKKEAPKKPTPPKSSKVEDETKVVRVNLNEYLEENTREFSSSDKVLMDKVSYLVSHTITRLYSYSTGVRDN